MYKSAGKKLNIKIYFHCRSVEFESRSQAVAESILSRKESVCGGNFLSFFFYSCKASLKGKVVVFSVCCSLWSCQPRELRDKLMYTCPDVRLTKDGLKESAPSANRKTAQGPAAALPP